MNRRFWLLAVAAAFVICPPHQQETGWGRQQPPSKPHQLLGRGKKLYEENCTPCHGSQGNGQGRLSKILNPPPHNFTEPLKIWAKSRGEPVKIFGIITKGIPGSAMTGFTFPDEDVWALVYTVMEFSREGPGSKK
jgi:mono/diheme cytochrome c family protein